MQTSLIDFSNDDSFVSGVGGNAQKIRISHEGVDYILKFGEKLEPDEKRPLQGSYNHAPISEHIGCSVLKQLGISVQETLLGTYHGREVVACKDFITPLGPNRALIEFKNLEHGLISESKRGPSPRLSDINTIIDTHPFLEGFRNEARNRYWDTFVADAIIGNFDRHSGNWGYIAQTRPNTNIPIRCVGLAPVYDCGSSMAPRLDEKTMDGIISSQDELKQRALSFPKAKLIVEGKNNVSYHEFITSPKGADARAAIISLALAIKNLDIDSICDNIPDISDTRKRFYKATLESRIEHIIQPAYELACRERDITPSKLIRDENILPEHDFGTHGSKLAEAQMRGEFGTEIPEIYGDRNLQDDSHPKPDD